jgi:MFS family permease
MERSPSNPSVHDTADAPPRRVVRAPLLVFVAVLATYLAVPCEQASDDNYDSELTAYSIATGHRGRLDALRPYLASQSLQHRATVIEDRDGRLIAGRGLGVALALVPAYALGHAIGLPPEVVLSDRFNQLFAATWCALAVAFFFATVRKLGDPWAAWFSAAAFAFGSSLLSILSREVWQHSLLVLLTAGAVWLLSDTSSRGSWWRLALAGFAAGWAVAARPTGVLLAIPLAWAAWRQHGRRSAVFLASLVPWVIAVAVYNWVEFGDPLLFGQTIIGASKFGTAEGRVFGLAPLASLSGALFSPGRGFFVFSPVFVLALALLPLVLASSRPGASGQHHGYDALRPFAGPAVAAILLNLAATAAWKEWAGGWTYGPRYVSDALVFWGLLLALGLSAARTLAPGWRRIVSAAATLTLVVSVANHTAGLLVNPYVAYSHSAVVQPDRHPERLWRWSEFPPLYNLRVWCAGGARGDQAPDHEIR